MEERQPHEQRMHPVILPLTRRSPSGHDAESFSAGQQTGARVAAITARLAAAELMNESRWWNRWRHRLMARALVAHAEEMEEAADDAGSAAASRRSALA